MRGPTWDQFQRAWQLGLGSGVVVWGTVVTARQSPSAALYVLIAGLALLGLRLSIPWERKNGNGNGGRKEDK